jgi:hypothetical protein
LSLRQTKLQMLAHSGKPLVVLLNDYVY